MKVKVTWEEFQKGVLQAWKCDAYMTTPIYLEAEPVAEEIKVTSCQHEWIFNKDRSLGICSNCKESVGGKEVGDNTYYNGKNFDCAIADDPIPQGASIGFKPIQNSEFITRSLKLVDDKSLGPIGIGWGIIYQPSGYRIVQEGEEDSIIGYSTEYKESHDGSLLKVTTIASNWDKSLPVADDPIDLKIVGGEMKFIDPKESDSWEIGTGEQKFLDIKTSGFSGFTNLSLQDVREIHKCASEILEKHDAENKKPITNLEKWNYIFKQSDLQCVDYKYDYNLSVYLDSKGVSADEAYRLICEGEKK